MKMCAITAATLLAATGVAMGDTVTTMDFSQGWGDGALVGSTTNNGFSNITATQARSGNGSMELRTTSGADKATAVGASLGGGVYGTLGDLAAGSLGFEWYRDGSSTTAANRTVSFKLNVAQVDSNNNVTGVALLVWEWVYNNAGAAATDTWVTEDLSDQNFWIRSNSQNFDVVGGWQTLDWFAAGNQVNYNSNTSAQLGNDWLVYGIELGLGSGWSDTFTGFADNVMLNFGNGGSSYAFNFETQVIPLPTGAWAGLSGLAMIPIARRIRRRSR